jgi:hypothetical protein
MKRKVAKTELFTVEQKGQKQVNDNGWMTEPTNYPPSSKQNLPYGGPRNTYWNKVWYKISNSASIITMLLGVMIFTGGVITYNRVPHECPYPLAYGGLLGFGSILFIVAFWNIFIDND